MSLASVSGWTLPPRLALLGTLDATVAVDDILTSCTDVLPPGAPLLVTSVAAGVAAAAAVAVVPVAAGVS